jgi:hypothetical protein
MFRRWISIGFLAAAATLPLSSSGRPGAGDKPQPGLVVWAWERPTDLTGITTPGVGVAFLGESILLQHDGIVVRPRRQKLRVDAATPLTAVVRIDVDAAAPPALSGRQRARTVDEVVALASRFGSRVSGVQIDFDAARSARDFYGALLRDLRGALRPGTRLSMTALASWCMGDPWIVGLPVDEAVPMLFRMGPDTGNVRAWLDGGHDFGPVICRGSVGLSTDEPPPRLPGHRRLYLFSPRAFEVGEIERLAREWNR